MPPPSKVRAVLNYHFDDGTRPWVYLRPRTADDPHPQDFGGESDPIEMNIFNARDKTNDQIFSLDEHSFELTKQKTKLSNSDFFHDPSKITSVYYQEMRDLIRQRTGATRVMILHHQVRCRNKIKQDGSVQDYAEAIHSDSCPAGAEVVFQQAVLSASNEDDNNNDNVDYTKGRFCISIRGEIFRTNIPSKTIIWLCVMKLPWSNRMTLSLQISREWVFPLSSTAWPVAMPKPATSGTITRK